MKITRLLLALIVVTLGTNLPVWAAPQGQKQVTYLPSLIDQAIVVTINTNFVVGVLAPANFTAVVNGKDIELTWDMAGTATSTIIVRQSGHAPVDVNDGVQIYNGDGTSFTDVGMANGDIEYFYAAWGVVTQKGLLLEGGDISREPSYTSAGGWGMTLLAYFVGIAILSFIAVKSEFILFKIAAMGGWFFMFMYLKSNPPLPLVEGSPEQQVLLIVCIAAGLGLGLMAFGRNANRSRQSSGISTSDWKWKFGKDKDEVEGRSAGHKETIEEYQARVRRALRRD